jgi:hypothetical protein
MMIVKEVFVVILEPKTEVVIEGHKGIILFKSDGHYLVSLMPGVVCCVDAEELEAQYEEIKEIYED